MFRIRQGFSLGVRLPIWVSFIYMGAVVAGFLSEDGFSLKWTCCHFNYCDILCLAVSGKILIHYYISNARTLVRNVVNNFHFNFECLYNIHLFPNTPPPHLFPNTPPPPFISQYTPSPFYFPIHPKLLPWPH